MGRKDKDFIRKKNTKSIHPMSFIYTWHVNPIKIHFHKELRAFLSYLSTSQLLKLFIIYWGITLYLLYHRALGKKFFNWCELKDCTPWPNKMNTYGPLVNLKVKWAALRKVWFKANVLIQQNTQLSQVKQCTI